MKKVILPLLILLISMPLKAIEVTKDKWFSDIETGLTVAFCNNRMFFRKCFSISALEC